MYFFSTSIKLYVYSNHPKKVFQSSYWDYGVIFGSHGYLGVRLETQFYLNEFLPFLIHIVLHTVIS